MKKDRKKFLSLSLFYILITCSLLFLINSQLNSRDTTLLKAKADSSVNDIKDGNLKINHSKTAQIYTDNINVPVDVDNVFKGSNYSIVKDKDTVYISTVLSSDGKSKTVLRLQEPYQNYRIIYISIICLFLIIYLTFSYLYHLKNKRDEMLLIDSQRALTNLYSNPNQEIILSNPDNDDLVNKINRLLAYYSKLLESKDTDSFAKFINLLEYPIFTYTKNGIIKTYNTSFEDIFPGVQNINSFNDEIPLVNFLINYAINSKEDKAEIYFKGIQKYYQLKISDLDSSTYLVTMLDTTSYIEAAINQDMFVSNVSHELKTPLTSIIGFSELLAHKNLRENKIKEFSQIINSEAKRLERLVQDTLKLTKNTKDMEFAPTEVTGIIEEILDSYQLQISEKNLQIERDFSTTNILSNHDELYIIIKNIIENAIFYNIDGGKISISIENLEDKVILSVKDTGIGISLVEQEKIFDRFYRADSSRQNITNGTGLGLAIVKHASKQIGADLIMQSKLGLGTKIQIIINKKRA